VTRRRLLVALGLTAAAGADGGVWELTRGSKPANLAGSNSHASAGKKPAAGPTHHATTQQAWAYQTGGQIASGIAVANGRVYAGDSSGNLYAVNARTGRQIWTLPTFSVIESGIAVADGIVYFGGGNVLYAVGA
jgi:eukaryotic-like serine/threonine-protein kinase